MVSREDLMRSIYNNFPFGEFREHQEDAILQVVQAYLQGKKFVVVESPTGCHAKGQEVLMFDGSRKKVENIGVNDQLMGPDSQPRTVLRLCRGKEQMVKVVPIKGDPWVVNNSHILSLVRTNDGTKRSGKSIDISVEQYKLKSKTFKHTHKLFRSSVNFPNKDTPLDPYYLGLWLGDGTRNNTGITSSDSSIIEYCKKIGEYHNLHYRIEKKQGTTATVIHLTNGRSGGTPNPILDVLREKCLTVEGEKCIPFEYLTNNTDTRLELLAGLIDSDGDLNKGCYSITTKFSRLRDDILYLCRSLGFAAYSSEVIKKIKSTGFSGKYHRISISGFLQQIPTHLVRKKALVRQQKKDVLRTGFSLIDCDEDQYYGFTLDEDGRYLLGDFTVTHNSGKSVIAYTAAKVIQEVDPFPEHRINQKTPGPYSVATTKTRALQTQYRDTFSDMPLIWSATNYECAVHPYDQEAHWGAWHCMKGKCDKFNQCAFFKAKQQFMMGQIGVTNYAYFLHQNTLSPHIVVIDEAHNLEESLCTWMTVSLSKKFMPSFFDQLLAWQCINEEDWATSKAALSWLLELDPKQKGWMRELRDWCGELQEIAIKAHQQIEAFFERCREDQTQIRTEEGKKMTKFSKYFRNLARTLGLLVETKTEWVIADRELEKDAPLSETQTIHFKPLYIEEVSQYFFSKAGFFILMSATVCGHETLMKYLGVPKEKYHYIGVPSVIQIEQRPVYAFKNLGKLVWGNKEEMLPKFVNYLDSIIESQFVGVRGIVHTVSYENAQFIEVHSRNAHRMKFPKTEQLTEVLDLIQSAPDTIVVSPSVVEGLDLKDDLCRFSVFFKIPWAPLGDEWVKRRKVDQKWYARNAAVQVVQGSGRGTRSKEDHSVTVILDASFLHIWYSHQDVLPDWFIDAVQIVKL